VPAARHPGRVGYVIGKRALPLAVDRNRVKRILRAVVAAGRPALDAYDLIVRLKRPCTGHELAVMRAEAVRLLGALPR